MGQGKKTQDGFEAVWEDVNGRALHVVTKSQGSIARSDFGHSSAIEVLTDEAPMSTAKSRMDMVRIELPALDPL